MALTNAVQGPPTRGQTLTANTCYLSGLVQGDPLEKTYPQSAGLRPRTRQSLFIGCTPAASTVTFFGSNHDTPTVDPAISTAEWFTLGTVAGGTGGGFVEVPCVRWFAFTYAGGAGVVKAN